MNPFCDLPWLAQLVAASPFHPLPRFWSLSVELGRAEGWGIGRRAPRRGRSGIVATVPAAFLPPPLLPTNRRL